MDWKTPIDDIQALGYSQAWIGAEIKKSQPWIADLYSGRYKDVKWSDGEKLRKLHSKLMRSHKRAA